MTTKHLLRSSGFAALAAAMAMSVLPEESAARDNDRGGWSQRSSGGDRSSARSESSSRPDRSSSSRSSGSSGQSRSARSEAPRPQAAPRADYTPPRQVSVPASRIETRSVRSEPSRTSAGKAARESWAARRDTPRAATPAAAPRTPAATDSGRDRSYGANRSAGTADQPSWAERRGLPDQRSSGSRDGRDGRGGDRSGNWNGGRDGDRDRDGDRSGNWSRGGDRDRDGDRGGNWGGRDGNRDGNWDRDHRGRDGDRDHRRWDNRWRNNDRYDWHRYRDSNRTVFHLGLYYAPYRNYSYSRIGVGFYLDSLFFGSRYWIDDPWTYRLPEVYGPYRWVRYYDDVVLVDIYTGEVVDVIYDFFW